MTQTVAIRLLSAAVTTGDGRCSSGFSATGSRRAGGDRRGADSGRDQRDGAARWRHLGHAVRCSTPARATPAARFRPVIFPAPIRQIKGNIGTLAGGTNPSVSLYFTARR